MLYDADGLPYRAPDLKPHMADADAAVGVPFAEWIHPKHGHRVITRSEILGLLKVMLLPLHREIEHQHRVIYRLQRRTLRYWLARAVAYLRRPLVPRGTPPIPPPLP